MPGQPGRRQHAIRTFPQKIKILLLAAALAGAHGAALADDIKIGLNSDMSATGSADFGISALAGARQAADDLNAGGGVLGKKVVIVERDDVGAPPKAIQNTNELIDNVKVNAMLGGVNSGNMLAWLHLVQQKKIPTISPVATATDITGRYAKSPPNYVFRVSMRDRDQIALLAAYAARASKTGKVAIIADTTGYGQQGAKDAVEILALHKIAPVANEVRPQGHGHVVATEQDQEFRRRHADRVCAGRLQRSRHAQHGENRLFPDHAGILGQPEPAVPAHRRPGAGQQDDLHRLDHGGLVAGVRTLYDTLMKRDGRVPTYVMAAQAYDSVKLIAAAMEQAKSTEGVAVQAALENLIQAKGVIKTYEKPFTADNHEALSVQDFRLVRWVAGKVVSVDDEYTRAMTPDDLKR